MVNRSRQIVGGALTPESPPPTLGPSHSTDWTATAMLFLRALWQWRYELLLLAVPCTITYLFAQIISWFTAGALSAVVVLCLMTPPALRRFVGARMRDADLRRRWDAAARHAQLATMSDRVPTPVRICQVPGGQRLRVRIPSGGTAEQLDKASEIIATHLEVRKVRVERDADNARYASVQIIRTDPLSAPTGPWPHLDVSSLSIWDPIPVGIDEVGETVFVSMPGHHILIGGEPEAGKSVSQSQLVASAALDPNCDLTLLDGKRVELAAWSESARYTVGPSISEAIDVLKELRVEMESRYERLLSERKRKVEPHSDIRLHVVVCDELAFYLTLGDRKENAEFANLARDLVARGRAAGIVVLAATQKPSHDIIPTSLRDLFSFRWALRCTTPQASDTILGQGWHAEGYSATEIDAAHRGVGLLLHEGGVPVRLRSYQLNDDDIEKLARHVAEIRSSHAA